jgi:phospholipase C
MCSHGTACRFRAISRAGRRRALVFISLSPGHSPAVSTPFTVVRGRARKYTWDTHQDRRPVRLLGQRPGWLPGLLRGRRRAVSQNAGPVPDAAATPVREFRPVLRLTLASDGHQQVVYTLTPNDFAGQEQTVRVAGGGPKTADWPADADGYYDVTVTANSGDGFTRRYAGPHRLARPAHNG